MNAVNGKALRILHVSSSYPLNEADVTAPFMHELLQAQSQLGHDVSVLLPRLQGLVEGGRDGVTVIGVPYAPTFLQVWGYSQSLDDNGRIRRSALAVTPLAITSMTWAVRRELREHFPDVVHLHWVLPQGPIGLALPRNVPVVVSGHGADAKFALGRLAWLTRRVLGRADAVVAASSEILDSFAAIHPETANKSHVIPHGANPDVFAPIAKQTARTELGIDLSGPVVVAVGRLVAKKGFRELIEALSHLSDRNARLYIVGEGPQRSALERDIAVSAGGRAQLVGVQSRAQVAKWLAASDVVAIPSVEVTGDVDSGPVVLMEAMASGRPVVASRVGMAPDVVDPDVNGYLLDSLDPSEIGAKLTRAINDGERLGRGAERTFHKVGDWSRVAQALDEVYSMVIDSRAGRASG